MGIVVSKGDVNTEQQMPLQLEKCLNYLIAPAYEMSGKLCVSNDTKWSQEMN